MTSLQKKFLDILTDYGYDIFNLEMIKKLKKIQSTEMNQAIRSLSASGVITRLERGKYIKNGFHDPFVIGNFLANDGGIAYRSALNYHGLTEQFVNVVFVQTARRKPEEKMIAHTRYKFVKIDKRKLFGYINRGYGNHKYRITNVEKTILDCFEMPHLAGWYPEIIKAFQKAELNQNKLITYCKKVNNKSVIKRLGFLTEFLKKDKMEHFIAYAQGTISDSYSLFEIDGAKKGEYDKRWRLIINMPKEEIMEIANS